jgi:hypothetical protein
MKLTDLTHRPATISISTLARFWTSSGETLRSLSELARLSLESLAEMLISSNMSQRIPTQAEAQTILGDMGLDLGGIQRKNLLKAMVQEGHLDPSSLTQSQNLLRRGILPKAPLHHFNLEEAEQHLKALMVEGLTSSPKEDLRDLAIGPDDPLNKGELK